MTEASDVLIDLKWSDPVVRAGKALCTAEPTDDFWDYYRDNKDDLKKQGISVSKYTGKWQVCWWRELEVFYTQSYQNHKPIKKLKTTIQKGLLPYQVPHTIQIVNAFNRYKAALDGSKTGTGKTYTTAAAAAQLGVPLLICCPKIVIADWEAACAKFGVQTVGVFSWEKLRAGTTEFLRKVTKTDKDGDKKVTFQWALPENAAVVFDEAHRAGHWNTQNAEMLVTAAEQKIPVFTLSATLAEHPLQMRAVGFALKLFPNVSDFWGWAKGMGCAKTQNGWEFVGDGEQIKRIHHHLYPDRGSRMPSDVLPDTQIQAQAYTFDDAKKVEAIYREMQEALERLSEKASEDDDNHLTIQLRARQKVELLKVPIFDDLVNDYRDNGYSVAVFLNFRESMAQLLERHPDAAVIHGDQTQKERDAEIAKFQTNQTRKIIVQIRAGGVGVSLHDLDGNFPRTSLISPTNSAKDLIQVFGRVQRANGKSKSLQRVVFAAGTVEVRVCERVQEKINNIHLLNDGDLSAAMRVS